MIIYITGGQRSGKSSYAEEWLAGKEDVCYIATAKVEDEEMAERVRKHQARRPHSWRTFEGYENLSGALGDETFYLLDCLGNLLSNILFDQSRQEPSVTKDSPALSAQNEAKVETLCKEELADLFNRIQEKDKTLLVVSNEVGSSLTPMTRLGRAFTDILGRLNQFAAQQADQAFLLVSGLPLRLK